MSRFAFPFNLPAVQDPDVAKRELSVTIEGQDPVVRSYDGQPTASDEWEFDDGAKITAVLVDIDGHGNRSQRSAPFNTIVTDTVPPHQPGELSVGPIRQIG